MSRPETFEWFEARAKSVEEAVGIALKELAIDVNEAEILVRERGADREARLEGSPADGSPLKLARVFVRPAEGDSIEISDFHPRITPELAAISQLRSEINVARWPQLRWATQAAKIVESGRYILRTIAYPSFATAASYAWQTLQIMTHASYAAGYYSAPYERGILMSFDDGTRFTIEVLDVDGRSCDWPTTEMPDPVPDRPSRRRSDQSH